MTPLLSDHAVPVACDSDVPPSETWQRRVSGILVPVLLLALAASLRSVPLWDVARFDELYHVLAAEGWLSTGRPTIAAGEYTRAYLFTALIASLFDWLGPSLQLARLPSIVAGSLLVVCVFLWSQHYCGRLAAWIAALLLCLAPHEIAYSHFTRFYMVQSLLFSLGVAAVFVIATRPSLLRAALLLPFALLCFATALHLQITTLIGLAGVAAWLTIFSLLPWLRSRQWQTRILVAFGAAICAAAIIGAGVSSGQLQELLLQYREAAPWARAQQNNVIYYARFLLAQHPFMWVLTPIAVVAATRANKAVASLCTCIFFIGFVLLSFGGMKGYRFISFLMPYLFVLWALALQNAAAMIYRTRLRVVQSWPARRLRRNPEVFGNRFAVVALVAIMLVAVGPASLRTAAMFAQIGLVPVQLHERWPDAARDLGPWLSTERAVISDSEVHALYYLGRLDFAVSRSPSAGYPTTSRFSYDPRIGVSFADSAASMALILKCIPRGLIVVSNVFWQRERALESDLVALVEKRATQIHLDPTYGIRAFAWHSSPLPLDSSCRRVKALQLAPAAATRSGVIAARQ